MKRIRQIRMLLRGKAVKQTKPKKPRRPLKAVNQTDTDAAERKTDEADKTEKIPPAPEGGSCRSSHRLDAGSAGRKMEKRPLEAERLRHSGSWRQEGTDCPMLLILPRRCGIIATDSSLHHETIRRVTE